MKETSRIKSSFIHATRGGWEQLPLLKDQLLELQEKLLKAYKDLLALEEEKKEREVALAEAREASKKAVEEAVLLRERALTVEEAASKAWEEDPQGRPGLPPRLLSKDEGGARERRDR